jgi:5-methylcytosine-specific restriction endonuclease McrA
MSIDHKAIKVQLWLRHFGEIYKAKCSVTWCSNIIYAVSYDVGHNIPKSKGGKDTFDNLIPICRDCNCGMGNKFTIKEWIKEGNKILGKEKQKNEKSEYKFKQKLNEKSKEKIKEINKMKIAWRKANWENQMY